MLILAGPSCAGKDTLIARLLERYPELRKPVTTTTRPPRTVAAGAPFDEIPGVHYHFRSKEDFQAGVERGEFIESAQFGSSSYGLTRAALDDVRAQGGLPAVILDVQGVDTVRQMMPTAAVFIAAPLPDIESRMHATRPPDQVAERLATARGELARAFEFDHIVVNRTGALEQAFAELCAYYEGVVRPRLQGWAAAQQQPVTPATPAPRPARRGR